MQFGKNLYKIIIEMYFETGSILSVNILDRNLWYTCCMSGSGKCNLSEIMPAVRRRTWLNGWIMIGHLAM